MQYQLKPQGDKESAPTCCIRFRPNTAGSRAKNVLTSVNANGTVRHWHMTSMKCLHTIVEEGNQVYALDYRGDGLKFATAGQDYQVTIPKHKPQRWAQVCDCGAAQRNGNKTNTATKRQRNGNLNPKRQQNPDQYKTIESAGTRRVGKTPIAHARNECQYKP